MGTSRERWRQRLPFAAAPLAVGVAVALHLAPFSPPVIAERPYMALFAAVLVTGWFVGIGPALLTAALGAPLGYFWLYPLSGGDAPGFSLAMFAIFSTALTSALASWRRALRRADAANRAKGRFLATVSHEIRTPMNAVIGMSSALLDTPLTRAQRELAATIRSSSEALLGLLNEVLDFSKIESGRLQLDNRPFALRECVASALALLSPGAAGKGLELRCAIDPDVPEAVVADASRLRQVLVNLVGNAIKFTARGEVALAVWARMLEGGEEWELHFAIRDTGIGVPVDRRKELFQAFSQLDVAGARAPGGTGLGLAISRMIVEAMGGTVSVVSEGVPGRGSTFAFTIRAEAAPAGAERVAPPDDAERELDPALAVRHPLRILVAEDNATNQRVTLQYLSRMGYRADVAANGIEAIAAVVQRPYDLVLMDVWMPEVDGVRATRRIRAKGTRERQPYIVGLTANADADDHGAYLSAGMDECLVKPLRASELRAVVERCPARGPLAN